jgi:hypothetical protein
MVYGCARMAIGIALFFLCLTIFAAGGAFQRVCICCWDGGAESEGASSLVSLNV